MEPTLTILLFSLHPGTDKQNRKYQLDLELQIRPVPPRLPKEKRKSKQEEEDDWYQATLNYIRDEAGHPELADLLEKHEQQRKEFRQEWQRDFLPEVLRTPEE